MLFGNLIALGFSLINLANANDNQQQQVNFAFNGHNLTPTIYNSSAPNAQNQCSGYEAVDIEQNENGLKALLKLKKECNVYGTDLDNLVLDVQYQGSERLAVAISPKVLTRENETFYLLPDEIVPTGKLKEDNGYENSELIYEHGNEPSFWFRIKRKDTGDVLFDTEGSTLVFENQFLEFKTSLPKDHRIYGIGETMGEFQLKPGMVRTMWNADIGDFVHANLYGTHPVYMEQRYHDGKGYAHGMFLRNAHGQEVLIGEQDLTWRAIGGSIEFYFYSGSKPTEVIRQHQEVVGLPAMHQYWTLGFHQSRWGMETADELYQVAQKYTEAGIPLETMWSDLDYMDGKKDFTVDPDKYGNFKQVLDKLHEQHRYYVPLTDAAIAYADDYKSYKRGSENNVFVQTHDNKEFIGEVWPGKTVYPDWLARNTFNWWLGELKDFHEIVPYDGVWLDMNEVSCFCTENECEDYQSLDEGPYGQFFNGTVSDKPHVNARSLRFPPYALNNTVSPNELGGRTMPMSNKHENGVREYDWHNLWGYQICQNTYNALVNEVMPNKRPFLISRSTFAGSGAISGHWGGDNWKEWRYMRYSITQGFAFSLYGMPMFGVDVCGFAGEVEDDFEEMCGRWAQLGAFFSFYRNHVDNSSPPQEFYVWDSVSEAANNAMAIRYRLLPYFYTLLENAHSKGDTFMRALSWEFPNQQELVDVEEQFMVGDAIMVAPVLEQGVDKLFDVVFPQNARWFDWYSHEEVVAGKHTVYAPLGHIPVYIRGGSILATQEPGLTTFESRQGEWTIIVALDSEGGAKGEVYLDDGESIQSDYAHLFMNIVGGKLKVETKGYYKTPKLKKIIVIGSSNNLANSQNSYEIIVDKEDWINNLEIEL